MTSAKIRFFFCFTHKQWSILFIVFVCFGKTFGLCTPFLLYVTTSCCECFTTGTSFLALFIVYEYWRLIIFMVLFWNSQLAASRHCDTHFLLFLRFRSIHCLVYPDTPWCPSARRLWRPSKDAGRLMEDKTYMSAWNHFSLLEQEFRGQWDPARLAPESWTIANAYVDLNNFFMSNSSLRGGLNLMEDMQFYTFDIRTVLRPNTEQRLKFVGWTEKRRDNCAFLGCCRTLTQG